MRPGPRCRARARPQANFALRRSIYGDAAVGERNIEMVDTARALGLAAKFTGSGGACICLKRPTADAAAEGAANGGVRVAVESPLLLSEAEEEAARKVFNEKGFTFIRIRFDDDHSGGGRSPLPPSPSSGALRGAVLQID